MIYKLLYFSISHLLTPYSGLKKPSFSHQAYHAASTYRGLYVSGIGHMISFFSPGGVLMLYKIAVVSFFLSFF